MIRIRTRIMGYGIKSRILKMIDDDTLSRARDLSLSLSLSLSRARSLAFSLSLTRTILAPSHSLQAFSGYLYTQIYLADRSIFNTHTHTLTHTHTTHTLSHTLTQHTWQPEAFSSRNRLAATMVGCRRSVSRCTSSRNLVWV
jgi:hypothetical protein